MVKLTQYSHGAGCGCKIAPEVLDRIVGASQSTLSFDSLLVGNATKDDAAVVAIDQQRAIVSTTDFFMPIVDDPFDFGRIAATNAISDIYAMGATPICAIAILGWPIDKLGPDHAHEVVAGGRAQCDKAGIPLAGGHSIDSPEPIFGLAVTGIVERDKIATNGGCIEGDHLYITKPIGIGVVTTAQKRGIVDEQDIKTAIDMMTSLNSFGAIAAAIDGVNAITDVTGFGLVGHALELAEASNTTITIDQKLVPLLPNVDSYIAQGAVPGGSSRNYQSFKNRVSMLSEQQISRFCDPQTSGGLLISVSRSEAAALEKAAALAGQALYLVGEVNAYNHKEYVEIN